MVNGVAETLEKIAKMKSKKEKVEALRASDSFAIRTVLRGALDPRIKWILPEGTPPYKPNDLVDLENVFIRECRKLMYFVEGPAPNVKQIRRETMFIELLESVAPADATLLCSIKEKKLPWKGITVALVQEAFPDLLPEENK